MPRKMQSKAGALVPVVPVVANATPVPIDFVLRMRVVQIWGHALLVWERSGAWNTTSVAPDVVSRQKEKKCGCDVVCWVKYAGVFYFFVQRARLNNKLRMCSNMHVAYSREVQGKLRKMQAALKQAKRKDYYKVCTKLSISRVKHTAVSVHATLATGSALPSSPRVFARFTFVQHRVARTPSWDIHVYVLTNSREGDVAWASRSAGCHHPFPSLVLRLSSDAQSLLHCTAVRSVTKFYRPGEVGTFAPLSSRVSHACGRIHVEKSRFFGPPPSVTHRSPSPHASPPPPPAFVRFSNAAPTPMATTDGRSSWACQEMRRRRRSRRPTARPPSSTTQTDRAARARRRRSRRARCSETLRRHTK